jgi:ABC-type uncharacterized transport system ATPase subunit
VERSVDLGAETSITLSPDGDSQELLRALQEQGPVTRFDLGESSLREIFLDLVGASRMEEAAA